MKVIGRKEKVSLPELDLFDIHAKIDTGAYTSSLHCHQIEEKNGQLICQFINNASHEVSAKTIIFARYSRRNVKSSNGLSEQRYAIQTKIKIGMEALQIELTLTDRSKMKNALLIGRKFLRKRFLVDVSAKNKLTK